MTRQHASCSEWRLEKNQEDENEKSESQQTQKKTLRAKPGESECLSEPEARDSRYSAFTDLQENVSTYISVSCRNFSPEGRRKGSYLVIKVSRVISQKAAMRSFLAKPGNEIKRKPWGIQQRAGKGNPLRVVN